MRAMGFFLRVSYFQTKPFIRWKAVGEARRRMIRVHEKVKCWKKLSRPWNKELRRNLVYGGFKHYLFFHILGISSSQLTNSYF